MSIMKLDKRDKIFCPKCESVMGRNLVGNNCADCDWTVLYGDEVVQYLEKNGNPSNEKAIKRLIYEAIQQPWSARLAMTRMK